MAGARITDWVTVCAASCHHMYLLGSVRSTAQSVGARAGRADVDPHDLVADLEVEVDGLAGRLGDVLGREATGPVQVDRVREHVVGQGEHHGAVGVGVGVRDGLPVRVLEVEVGRTRTTAAPAAAGG